VAVVVLGEAPGTVAVGGTFLLGATALDRRNQPLVRRGITWTSSDSAVALVTAEGWVAALRPGTVVLTASCEGASASMHVTVTARSAIPAPVPAPHPRPEPVLRRRSRRSRRRRLGGVAALAFAAGVWGWLRFGPAPERETGAVSSGPVAAAEPAPGPEAAAAIPAAESVGRTSSGAAVSPAGIAGGRLGPPVTAVAIDAPPPLRVGDRLQLHAVALGAAGDTLAVPVRWRSDDSTVAAVDYRSGVVLAVAPGTVLLHARGGRRSSSVELTVLSPAVVTVQILGARLMAVRETLALHLRAFDASGQEVEGRPATWSSSDFGVAVVGPASGMVVAQAPGLTHVTATVDGVSARVPLTIVPRPERLATRGVPGDAATAAALRKGVEECYGALRGRDLDRIAQLYQPSSSADRETLKRLTRLVRVGGGASIGARTDYAPVIHTEQGSMEFAIELSWMDGTGARHQARPLFRADFAREDSTWTMTACRIVGSPGL
jgi:hypothetical protein